MDSSAAPPASAPPAPHDAVGSSQGNARRRDRNARLLGAWRRHDVGVPAFHIEVPLDGSVVAVTTLSTYRCGQSSTSITRQPTAMRPLTTKRNEIPRAAVADEAAFHAAVTAVLDAAWQPAYPELELTAFAQPLGDDEYLVSVSLRNTTQLTGRTPQDLSAYDCQLAIFPAAATPLIPRHFDLAPDDYRLTDLADIVGHGTGCVAVATETGGIRTETLPTFTQPVIEPRDDHVIAPRWTDLARNPSSFSTAFRPRWRISSATSESSLIGPQDSRTTATLRKTLNSSPTSFAASDWGAAQCAMTLALRSVQAGE